MSALVAATDGGDDAAMGESLIRDFDQIYQGYKDALLEIQSLKLRCNYETSRFEALEATCTDLRTDNEQLRRLHHESLQKFVDELDDISGKMPRFERGNRKSKYQASQLGRGKHTTIYVYMTSFSEKLCLNQEYRKTMDMFKQENELKIYDLEMQVSCQLQKQASDKALINQLQQELAVHEAHIEILTSNFETRTADLQSKYESEIQELKYCLLAEQGEKNKLQEKLQSAEKEFDVIKKKQEKQQRDSISLHHVETLKQRIMRLRKENESLKRQASSSKDADHT